MSVSENMPHFGEPRIALLNKETGEFKELGKVESTSLAVEKDAADGRAIHTVGGVFNFKITVSRKKVLRLLQFLGFMKPPRYTYKTIKRDCAKRNR